LHKLLVDALAYPMMNGLILFYPSNLDRKDFPKYYIQVFHFVEIDSSFYIALIAFYGKTIGLSYTWWVQIYSQIASFNYTRKTVAAMATNSGHRMKSIIRLMSWTRYLQCCGYYCSSCHNHWLQRESEEIRGINHL